MHHLGKVVDQSGYQETIEKSSWSNDDKLLNNNILLHFLSVQAKLFKWVNKERCIVVWRAQYDCQEQQDHIQNKIIESSLRFGLFIDAPDNVIRNRRRLDFPLLNDLVSLIIHGWVLILFLDKVIKVLFEQLNILMLIKEDENETCVYMLVLVADLLELIHSFVL